MDRMMEYEMERRRETMDICRSHQIPGEIIGQICEYDVPLRDLVEAVQNRLEHYIHAMDHFHRRVYRYTKFVSDAVRKEVEHWFALEESHQAVFRVFLERHQEGFRWHIGQTGYDVLRVHQDLRAVMDAVEYIQYFQYWIETFHPPPARSHCVQ